MGHLQALVGNVLVPIKNDVQVQGARAIADAASLAPHGSLQGTGVRWFRSCLPDSLQGTTGRMPDWQHKGKADMKLA